MTDIFYHLKGLAQSNNGIHHLLFTTTLVKLLNPLTSDQPLFTQPIIISSAEVFLCLSCTDKTKINNENSRIYSKIQKNAYAFLFVFLVDVQKKELIKWLQKNSFFILRVSMHLCKSCKSNVAGQPSPSLVQEEKSSKWRGFYLERYGDSETPTLHV